MAPDLSPAERQAQYGCKIEDGKHLRCALAEGHTGMHQRPAVPGEAPYLEDPAANSIISWPQGPAPRPKP